jgi:hypothetical protein
MNRRVGWHCRSEPAGASRSNRSSAPAFCPRGSSLRKAAIFCAAFVGVSATTAMADCRKVAPSSKIVVSADALRDLATIGVDRPLLFEAIKDVSIPETSGCWAGATGDFDGQLVSAGVLQWNYGQKSLQPILRKYRDGFSSKSALQQQLDKLMPRHGRLIFSEACLRSTVTDDCRNAILALQSHGDLAPSLKGEFNALFESDQMIQIQMDRFVALVQSVKDDLRRMFGKASTSVRKIKWAIDTKVQQGGFPGDENIRRVRSVWSKVKPEDRREKFDRLVQWYEALSNAVDQDGTKLDWKWNVEKWRKKIAAGMTDEQMDLLNLSFLRSRAAGGESGRWQALTFQRRATIVLGIGSTAGHRLETPDRARIAGQ